MAEIYQIRNLINNKIYIGSTTNTKNRWRQHRSCLRGGYHHNPHLQHSWNKYGDDAFIFCTLITCDPSMCIWYEQQFIDQWKPKYNICFAAGSRLGIRHSEQTKRKISHTKRERGLSDATRAALLAANLGRHLTDEHKRKISDFNRGKIVSKETRKKMAAAKAKSFPSFIDPRGKVWPEGKNLSAFCRKHNLMRSCMWLVVHHQLKKHQGWKLYRPSQE